MLGFSSSGVTEMVSLTRVGLSFSTVVFTMLMFSCCVVARCAKSAIPRSCVGATGFEPAASRSQSGRSTKLSYAPVYCGQPPKRTAFPLVEFGPGKSSRVDKRVSDTAR